MTSRDVREGTDDTGEMTVVLSDAQIEQTLLSMVDAGELEMGWDAGAGEPCYWFPGPSKLGVYARQGDDPDTGWFARTFRVAIRNRLTNRGAKRHHGSHGHRD